MKILAFYNDDPTTVMAKVIDYYRSYRHYVYERNANFFVAAQMDVLPTVDLVLVETGKTNAAAIKVAYEAKSVTVKAFATADVTELVGADDPEYVVTPLE